MLKEQTKSHTHEEKKWTKISIYYFFIVCNNKEKRNSNVIIHHSVSASLFLKRNSRKKKLSLFHFTDVSPSNLQKWLFHLNISNNNNLHQHLQYVLYFVSILSKVTLGYYNSYHVWKTKKSIPTQILHPQTCILLCYLVHELKKRNFRWESQIVT